MVTSLPGRAILRLADGDHEIAAFGTSPRRAVKHFVLQEHHRVRIADGGLEQPLGVGGGRGRDHLEPRHMRIPGRIFLAVLRRHARRGPVRAPEHDGTGELPAGHIMRLGRRVDDMVDGLHREVEGHELDDGPQAGERRANAQAREARLRDGRVDHAARAELVEQALRDLIRALIFRDLLAHDEHGIVAPHLLGHRVAQRLAHGDLHHLRALGDFGGRCRTGLRAPRVGALAAASFSREGRGALRFVPVRGPPSPVLLPAGEGTRVPGAFAAYPLASAETSSPSVRITAIGVLTFTPSVPAGTKILPSLPSSTASISIVALSVSISAMTSPDRTASPSDFTHLASLPSSIVGDRAGIKICVGITTSKPITMHFFEKLRCQIHAWLLRQHRVNSASGTDRRSLPFEPSLDFAGEKADGNKSSHTVWMRGICALCFQLNL